LVENQRVPVPQAVQQAFGAAPAQLDQQVKDYFHSLKPLQKSLEEAQNPGPMPPPTPEQVQALPLPFSVEDVASTARDVPAKEADALLAEMELRIPEHRADATQKLEQLAAD